MGVIFRYGLAAFDEAPEINGRTSIRMKLVVVCGERAIPTREVELSGFNRFTTAFNAIRECTGLPIELVRDRPYGGITSVTVRFGSREAVGSSENPKPLFAFVLACLSAVEQFGDIIPDFEPAHETCLVYEDAHTL